MEPVEHFLFGAALSRAGFNRTTGYATVVMVLAAEAPDLDVLYSLDGPVAGFQHHRGWTHSLIATPVVALATVAVVWGISRAFLRFRSRSKKAVPAPVHWFRLFLLGWLAALSHLALDYTNNYGLRPFWPFSPKWYEGDIVFILEPLMLLVLALAVVVPWLLALTDGEIGARRVTYRGQRWAWFALAFIAVLWTVRAVEHTRAINTAQQRSWEAGEPLRIGLSPYPITPFQWHAVVDTGDKYQTAHIDTHTDQIRTNPNTEIFYKPAITPAIAKAESSRLGRAYMDWSSYPLVTAEDPQRDQSDQDESNARAGTLTPVEFNDLRFGYNVLGLPSARASKRSLGAEVLIGPDGSVVQMKMGNRIDK